MKRNVIVTTLVLIMLGTSGFNVYGLDIENKSIPATKIEEALKIDKPVKIISPQQDVIVKNSVLISVQLQEDISVALSVYKEISSEEKENLTIVMGPEEIEKGQTLNFYSKEIRNLSQGNYKIVFDVKDAKGNKQDSLVKEFIIKSEKEDIIRSIETIPKSNITNILEDVRKK